LVAQIEQKFKQRIALTELFRHATIESLANILRHQSNALPWSCLVPIQPNGDAAPLFIVHPGGGTVLCYLELAHHLGTDQPLYAFQAHGLERGQVMRSHVEDMARDYITAMKSVQPQGPYQIAGWSFGGLVAVEMGIQLQAQNETVSFVGLLDSTASSVVRDLAAEPQDDTDIYVDYFKDEAVEFPKDIVRQLDSEAKLDYVIQYGRQVGVFPSDVENDQTRRLIKTYVNNYREMWRYQPGKLDGRITLFQATDRTPEDLKQPPDHGWQVHTTQPLRVIGVPGQHHTIIKSPYVEKLVQCMKSCLGSETSPST
jgi:thioesterase domain-containing protein